MSNRLPLERMRGRNIKLMALPAKFEDEDDDAYKQRLRVWQGFQWRQYGLKKLIGGERVAGAEEQWVRDLKAEYAGHEAAAGVPDFNAMKPKEARAEAQRLWHDLATQKAASSAEGERATKRARQDLMMRLTPKTKERTAEQLGWSPPTADDEAARRKAQADMLAGLSPTTLQRASGQLRLEPGEAPVQGVAAEGQGGVAAEQGADS